MNCFYGWVIQFSWISPDEGLCSKHQLWKFYGGQFRLLTQLVPSLSSCLIDTQTPGHSCMMYIILFVSSHAPSLTLYILISVYIFFILFFIIVLTERICLIIKSFFSWWSFPLFSWPHAGVRVNNNRGNSYSSPLRVKGLIRAVSKSTLIISCSR